MNSALGWLAAALWVVFLLVVVRPYGGVVLVALSGGSPTGAFLVGLLLTLLPVVTVAGISVRMLRARAVGEEWTQRSHHNALMIASVVPLSCVPFLGSSRGAETSLEQSLLFEPFLVGLMLGFVPVLVVVLVTQGVRSARWAARHLENGDRDERGPSVLREQAAVTPLDAGPPEPPATDDHRRPLA